MQTLLICLSVAAALGLTIGCLLHFTSTTLSSLLNHESPKDMVPRNPKALYQTTSTAKKDKSLQAIDFKCNIRRENEVQASVNKIRDPNNRGLLGQIIIEEEDSDF